MEPASSGTDASLVNLEELLPGMRHSALVDHSFWTNCWASGQVTSVLDGYKELAGMLCDMIKCVFGSHAKFKHLECADVTASDLGKWLKLLPERLVQWVQPELLKEVENRFLDVCHSKQKALFSAGLSAVGALVQQCLAGKVPAMPADAQAKLLLKIPKAHPLRGLAASFLEAHVQWAGFQFFVID